MVSLIRVARSWSIPRTIFDVLAGYRRVFDSRSEASAVAARFVEAGDHSSDKARLHLSVSKLARPSDYPVLFHMDRLVPNLTSIFDLGGSVGNLFYCYARYLEFRPDVRWTVHDLPEMLELGRRMAHERGEHRLQFTADLGMASGIDLLIASGSLHYFEASLPEILSALRDKPKHVIINRSPLTTSKPVATVQDAGTHLVACRFIDREDLIRGMEKLGFVLADSWDVAELSCVIPFYPEYSVHSYSGLFFRLEPDTTVFQMEPGGDKSISS